MKSRVVAAPAPSPAVAGFFKTSLAGKNFRPQPKGSRNGFFPEGEFVCRIESVSISHRKAAYVIECTVVEGPEELVGERRACILLSNEYQPQNVAEFVCAAYGLNPASSDILQFGDDEMDASLTPDWSQLGALVRLTTREKTTKKGGQFTAHYWHPHPDTAAKNG